jgi:exosortase
MSQLVTIEPLAKVPSRLARQSMYWLQSLTLLSLTVWLYASIFTGMVRQWSEDPNYSHGFLVVPFSLFVFWRSRSRFQALPVNPSSWGLLVIAVAVFILVAGSVGAELFVSRLSIIFLIAGLVVLCWGWTHLWTGLFPLGVLILMIPVPAIILNPITLPLQLLASKLAAITLPMFGVPVLREGNIVNLPIMSLEVAQACSGIRSLYSLITLATIYGYLVNATIWTRTVLVLAAIPIAIAANSLRIVGTGLLVQYWNPVRALGFFHEFSGGLLFLVSLLMLILVHQVLAMKQAGVKVVHVL